MNGINTILLFTDGNPDSTSATTRAVKIARQQGIQLVAVATGGADINFLTKLIGDRSVEKLQDSGNQEVPLLRSPEIANIEPQWGMLPSLESIFD